MDIQKYMIAGILRIFYNKKGGAEAPPFCFILETQLNYIKFFTAKIL